MGFVAFLLVAALLNVAGVLLSGKILDFLPLMLWGLFAGLLLVLALFAAIRVHLTREVRTPLKAGGVVALGVGAVALLAMLPFGSMALAALSISLWKP